jgi:hypothetical protein
VKNGPYQAALTDYLSGRYVPGLGPESIYTTESLCMAALAALRHADAASKFDPDRPCERDHPEITKLCIGLRALGIPCDGFTPASDALTAIVALKEKKT